MSRVRIEWRVSSEKAIQFNRSKRRECGVEEWSGTLGTFSFIYLATFHSSIVPISQYPSPMKFVNVSGKALNTIHANDFHFYEEVHHICCLL